MYINRFCVSRIGKLILLGAIFRCLDPVLTIGAILSYRSPFVSIITQCWLTSSLVSSEIRKNSISVTFVPSIVRLKRVLRFSVASLNTVTSLNLWTPSWPCYIGSVAIE